MERPRRESPWLMVIAAQPRVGRVRSRRAVAVGMPAVLAALCLFAGVAQASAVRLTFTTAGCTTTTVPSLATSVGVYAVGAAGDTGGVPLGATPGGTGGMGDSVSATMSAQPGNSLAVCVDWGAGIGGNTGAGGVNGGGGGGASYVYDAKLVGAKQALIIAGGGGGGGSSGGYGFVAGDGGNAGDAGSGPLGSGGPAPPSSSNALNNGASSPQPDGTAYLLEDGQDGAGDALGGAGGGGGAGYYGGYGGGYTGIFATPQGDGGGSGGSDYCVNSNLTSGCTIVHGAGTVHGAGSAPGDAEVVLTYDLPDPTISITTPADGASYALNQVVTPSFSCSDPSGIYECEVEAGIAGGQLNTASPGIHSFTVAAVADDGSTATKTVTYTVAEPTESITTPAANATYLQGQLVSSNFSCADGAGAPGLTATGGCVDQNGNPSGTTLDTSTPGVYTYKVTATSQDGQSTTSTVTYYVAEIQISRPDPSGDSVYSLGQTVGAEFICTIPGIPLPTCVDANGNPFGTSLIDTSTTGKHTFKVFASGATSGASGQPAELDVPYDVQAPQTISWDQPLGPVAYGQLPDLGSYGQGYLLDATASSGLPVTFSVVSGPCTVTRSSEIGWYVTASGAGSCVIDANQAGDGVNYAPAPTVQETLTVDQAVMHVDADSVSTPYGTTPTFGYTLRASDFVGGDTPATIQLTGSPVCTSSTGPSPNVGTYPGAITCDPSGMSSPNYTFVAGNSGDLTVIAVLESIAVTPDPASVPAGETVTFTATGTYSDGSTAPLTSGVSWTESSGGTVSTIDPSSGVATGVAKGTDTITATDGSVSGQAQLTVTAPVLTGLTVNPASLSLAKGTTGTVKVTGAYSDGSIADLTGTVTWSSSDTAVATVTGGTVTAVGTGTATITASDGSQSVQAQVTVTAATLKSIQVTPSKPSLAKGTTTQLKATGTYTDGSTADLTGTVTWSSSDIAVATVSGGTVTGVGTGTATITASDGSITATNIVTVTAATLQSITITPASPSAAAGDTVQMVATGIFSDGTQEPLASQVMWSSSNTSVATVNASGLAIAKATGTTTIRAIFDGITASVTLKVTPATLVSIRIDPSQLSIPLGSRVKVAILTSYSNGTSKPLSGGVRLTSSDKRVVTVHRDQLTAVGRGTATLTASDGKLTATATVTVTGPQLRWLVLRPRAPHLHKGKRIALRLTGIRTNRTTVNLDRQARWSTRDRHVATVNKHGVVTAIAHGVTEIRALAKGRKVSIRVTVH